MYPDEIGALIANAAPVPMYASSELPFGRGIVGGMMRDTEAVGRRVGEIALQILEGTPPASIPIGTVPTVPIFDWRQIERWGIDPAALPPGSLVRFKVPGAWETYRGPIVGTIIVVAAQLLLITALLTQRARRRRAEDTIRAREVSLRASYERIRQMAGRLINAQEATRATIAKDLHDDVCQRLTTASVAIDNLKSSRDSYDPQTQEALEDLSREMGHAFEGIRRLSHELHPVTLRVLGLAPTLKGHCAEVTRRHHTEIAFTADGDFQLVHPDVAVCFFRIAQESLRNGIFHGHAQRIEVTLTRVDNTVEMTVTDDGDGFDVDVVRRRGAGLGLVSMEERAHAVGGEFHIVSGPRLGTTVRVRGPADIPRSTQAADVGVSDDAVPPARTAVH
jgi:signal transduction histidine kinase